MRLTDIPEMQNEKKAWTLTSTGEPRGYIEPYGLKELWFHTGTACNLECPFCLEGSSPGDNRLGRMTLRDTEPYIREAVELGVEQFSFTGGEPFIVKDFVNILALAASYRPCLVLTNGTDPLLKRLHQIEKLREKKHPINFRISIDWPDQDRHDAGRGAGTFLQSLEAIKRLQKLGFNVSLARQAVTNEDSAAIDEQFRSLLREHGCEDGIRIVAFPDFALPGENPAVPEISKNCMTIHHTAESRKNFMCAFSKMLVKKKGKMRVFACTLVDDDDRYDQGNNLRHSLGERVTLEHHRCYSCFSYGSSCSEIA
ncbi:MAG: radical SAM protein [Gammaproteobacteria bacterium]